jgi:succinate dehydrogenase / fumarate reductase cytochrome b subunit
MRNNDRPLSPHLSIYRWPITMITSILHRATGLALSFAFILLTLWLFDVAMGEKWYGYFFTFMNSFLGRLFLVGISLAFFYHLSNGIRHLVWDSGRGFKKSTADASAWFVLAVTLILTSLFWWARL